jgi:hypothetical protein
MVGVSKSPLDLFFSLSAFHAGTKESPGVGFWQQL